MQVVNCVGATMSNLIIENEADGKRGIKVELKTNRNTPIPRRRRGTP